MFDIFVLFKKIKRIKEAEIAWDQQSKFKIFAIFVSFSGNLNFSKIQMEESSNNAK